MSSAVSSVVSEPSAGSSSTLPPMDARAVLRVSGPIMVSMLSFTVLSLVDVVLVGRLGTAQLAGVGLAGTASHLCNSFGMGLLMGARVVVAQRTGALDHEAGRRLALHAMAMALGFGLFIAVLAPHGDALFRLFGAEEAVVVQAQGYFGWRMLCAPFFQLNFALSAWFGGRGETRITMVGTLLGNLVTILLDPLLIFGFGSMPGLGAEGAAIAFGVGALTTSVFLLSVAIPRLRGTPLAFERRFFRDILRVGLPIGIELILDFGSFFLFTGALSRSGQAELAAHVLVLRLASVSFLPGYAIGDGTSVLVGQAVGAGRPDRAWEAWRVATRLTVGLMAAWALLFVVFPLHFIEPFGASPEVAVIARRLLMLAAAWQVFDAVAMVARGALNGAGDTAWTMRTSIILSWLVKLPLGVLLALGLGFGAVGAWTGIFVEVVLLSALSLRRILRGSWLPVTAGSDKVALRLEL